MLLAVTGILTTARRDSWQRRASINSTTGLMTEHGTPWAGLLVEPFIQVSQQASAKTYLVQCKVVRVRIWERRLEYVEQSGAWSCSVQGAAHQTALLTR